MRVARRLLGSKSMETKNTKAELSRETRELLFDDMQTFRLWKEGSEIWLEDYGGWQRQERPQPAAA